MFGIVGLLALVGLLSAVFDTGSDGDTPVEPPETPSDDLIGTNGDDTLTGTMEVDIMEGHAGDDVISGLEGDDILAAGRGDGGLAGGGLGHFCSSL